VGDLLVDLVRERLLLDEDVPDVAACGLDVLLLVFLVVVRDLLVGDLRAGGYLLVDLVLDDARADVLANTVEREALLLQLGLELLLAGRVALAGLAEVLGLDRRELLVDVVVGHLDVHVGCLLLELGSLDEELHRLLAQGDVLGCARLGPLLLVRRVVPLGLVHQPVELILRDRLVADDRHVVRADARVAAAAAGRQGSGCKDDGEDGEKTGPFHEKSAICSEFYHAARRVSSIASTNCRASGNSSCLTETSFSAVR
jgi:hypothetical protein